MRKLVLLLSGISVVLLLSLGGRVLLLSTQSPLKAPPASPPSPLDDDRRPQVVTAQGTPESLAQGRIATLYLAADGAVEVDGKRIEIGRLVERLSAKVRGDEGQAPPGTPSTWSAILNVSASTPWERTRRLICACAHPTVGISEVRLRVADGSGEPFEQDLALPVMDPIKWFWKHRRGPVNDSALLQPTIHLSDSEKGGEITVTFVGWEMGEGAEGFGAIPERAKQLEEYLAPIQDRIGTVFLEPDVPTGNLVEAIGALRSVGASRFDFDHILPVSWEAADLVWATEGLEPEAASKLLIEALGRVGTEFSSRDITPESTVANTAHGRLVEMGAAAVPALARALRHEDPVIRGRTAMAIWYIGPPASLSALDALIDAFADESTGYYAGRAIRKMGRPAVPRLIAALKRPERYVRYGAAGCLEDLAAEEAAPALTGALRDEFWLTRLIAARALENPALNTMASLRALEALLQDDVRRVRIYAARTYFVTGGDPARVIEVLIEAMENGNINERPCAARAIALMGEKAAPALEPLLGQLRSGPHREWPALAIGGIGPEAEPAVFELLLALKDPDGKVSGEAARALGRIGAHPAQVVPALLLILDDAYTPARAGAAEALGFFPDHKKATVPALLKTLKDTSRPWAMCRAAESLIRLEHAIPETVEVILHEVLEDSLVYYGVLPSLIAAHPQARAAAIAQLEPVAADPEADRHEEAQALLGQLQQK